MNQQSSPTDVSIITTYRCCMHCKMCNIWQNPSDITKEIKAKDLEILPQLKFINITGGEPFVRRDLEEIIEVSFTKAPRVVISTAGYHVEETLALAQRFPDIGIRVSLEGLSTINDHMRGRDGGFDRGIQTLLGLRQMGIKDIGIAMTVSHKNCHELLPLYRLTKGLKMDFATATFHNSFYFHKKDNEIRHEDIVAEHFFDLADDLMKSPSPKDWFRSFFNIGLINYIHGNKRFLPCEAGTVNFFIEPYGDVYPCNGLEERYWKETMGNIKEFQSFESLWNGPRAQKVREKVASCPKNCWMVGTAAPVMKKYLKHPLKWVIKNKLSSLRGKNIDRNCLPGQYSVGQNPLQGDLRGGEQFPITDQSEFPVTSSQRLMSRVISNTPCTEDAFFLRVEKGQFRFFPGQYAGIGPYLNYGISRDYTFCSSPDDPFLEFLIKKVPNGKISNYLSTLSPGDPVELVGPYGDFFSPIESQYQHLFIATGVGIGPFLSLIKSRPKISYHLIHGIRCKDDLVLAQSIPSDRYTPCITRENSEFYRGRVTDFLKTYEIEANTDYFLCGNPYMLKQVDAQLRQKGVPQDTIYKEPYYTY